VVERHLLPADSRVESVYRRPDGIVVQSDVAPLAWVAMPVRTAVEGFDVLDVLQDEDIDPPPAPEGFAVAADGRSFHLNEPEGIRGFWVAAGGRIPPEELARHLAKYQSGDHEGRLLGAQHVPAPHLAEPSLESIPECELVADVLEGRLRLRFCSYAVSPTGPDAQDRISVRRWDVRADEESIDWSTELVAELLPDSRDE